MFCFVRVVPVAILGLFGRAGAGQEGSPEPALSAGDCGFLVAGGIAVAIA